MSTVVAHLRLWRELAAVCWRRAPAISTLVLGCLLLNAGSFVAVGLALKFTVDAGRGPARRGGRLGGGGRGGVRRRPDH